VPPRAKTFVWRLEGAWGRYAGARGRVFRYYAFVPHAYRFTPSRGSAAA